MNETNSQEAEDSLSLNDEEVEKEEEEEEEDEKKDFVLLVQDQEGPLKYKVEDENGEEYSLVFEPGAKNHIKKMTLGGSHQFMNLGFNKFANLITFRVTSFLVKSEIQIESKNKMMTTRNLLGKAKFTTFRKRIDLKLLKMNEEKKASNGARYKYCVAGDKVRAYIK